MCPFNVQSVVAQRVKSEDISTLTLNKYTYKWEARGNFGPAGRLLHCSCNPGSFYSAGWFLFSIVSLYAIALRFLVTGSKGIRTCLFPAWQYLCAQSEPHKDMVYHGWSWMLTTPQTCSHKISAWPPKCSFGWMSKIHRVMLQNLA